MVQYVFTPWRDRQELLLVREQLYGNDEENSNSKPESEAASQPLPPQQRQPSSPARRALQHQAVARISMWVQRGSCPHMAESTALLMAAVLSDEAAAMHTRSSGSETYAVRAAYSAAFSRFVTGLLDSHQDKLRKQSMYSIAKVIGLPATFVELRHQSTHEQLPSLAKLRSAASSALAWIWDYYWKHLSEADPGSQSGEDACRALLLSHLREEEDARKALIFKDLAATWETDRLLKTLAELQDALPGNQVYLKCLKLSRDLLALGDSKKADKEREEGAQEAPSQEAKQLANEQDELNQVDVPEEAQADGPSVGWTRYQGQWEPKPIGVV